VNANYLDPEKVATLCCTKTGQFRKQRNSKKGFKVCCPAHDDKTPSLSINHGDIGTVINCHAGCTTDQVMTAIGRAVSDLCRTQVFRSSKATTRSSVTYLPKDSEYSDNSDNSDNSVSNPFLSDIPSGAKPTTNDPSDVNRSLLVLIRFLALDKGMRNGDVIPSMAFEIIDAWRMAYAPEVDFMKIREIASSMWGGVKVSIADGVVRTMMRKAQETTPETCPGHYRGTEYELLFGLCYYLSERNPDGIFYIPLREGAEVLQYGSKDALGRRITVMRREGIILKRPEFRASGYMADRYQLNPEYSSNPEGKTQITVASWHRYTISQLTKEVSFVQVEQVNEIKMRYSLSFDTDDFCRRAEAAHWCTDYGIPLMPGDLEAAVLSFADVYPKEVEYEEGVI